MEENLKTIRNEAEYPVLMDINDDRTRQGLSPVVKLTVPVLKKHLKGKTICGTEWRMGNKKREDLIEDYRSVTTPGSELRSKNGGGQSTNDECLGRAGGDIQLWFLR